MNGANVEIPSTWACMCQNLTWLDKTHAFMVWEGFKAQVCMSCLHNILWSSTFSSTFIMQSHYHHFPFPSTESLSKLSWNVMERLPTIPSPMPLPTDVARWAVNGANVEIPLTCANMRWNLTWLDKTHAFTLWEGFKAQGCMSCPHNVWDHPHFHQRSSCNLIVIFCHSHQRNICCNSL